MEKNVKDKYITELLCCTVEIGLPWRLSSKDSACNAGDLGSKILWRKAWQPSILAWRIPWTEEPGGLQFLGLQRVGHGSATEHTHTHDVLLLGSMVDLETLDLGHCFQKPPSTFCVMFPHLALLSCDSLTKHHKLGGSRPQGFILQQL